MLSGKTLTDVSGVFAVSILGVKEVQEDIPLIASFMSINGLQIERFDLHLSRVGIKILTHAL
jgi:hypothetical protein